MSRFDRRLSVALVPMVFSVHAVLLWLYHQPAMKRLWGDEVNYFTSARKLLAGRPDWHIESFWPELNVHFLAGVAAIFGTDAILPIQIVQSVLLVLAALLMADLVHRTTGSVVAALTAAGWMAGFPPLVAFCHYLWPEVLHLFLFLSVLWILRVHADSWRWCGGAGFVLGLALLSKSLLQPLVIILVPLLIMRRPFLLSCARMLVCCLLCVATVAPVLVANHARLGRAIIADSARFNLLVGLSNTGRTGFSDRVVVELYRELRASEMPIEQQNRVMHERIKRHLQTLGVVGVLKDQMGRQFFRLFDRASFLSEQLPGGAISKIGENWGYRGQESVLTQVVGWSSSGLYAVLLVSACFGYCISGFHQNRISRALLLFLVYNLALFLVLHVKSRYRIQLLPVLMFGSALLVAWLDGARQASTPRLTVAPWRWWLAGCLSALLLFLAFAGPWLDSLEV